MKSLAIIKKLDKQVSRKVNLPEHSFTLHNNHQKRKIDRLTQVSKEVGCIDKNSQSLTSRSPLVLGIQQNRLDFLEERIGVSFDNLRTSQIFNPPEQLKGYIENFIGISGVPTGVIGPLEVNGSAAKGSFFVPLATTEGTLVASYNRGAKACNAAGGITSICLTEGVQRSPLFKFNTMIEAGKFMQWAFQRINSFKDIVREKSKHAILQDVNAKIEGNNLILTFEYQTEDAAGQNMVTICTQRICDYLLSECPIQSNVWYIESNYSGDKKASAVSLSHVRGKKVSAEVLIPKDVVKKILKSTPEKMANYWQSSTLATIQSGTIGTQGHLANGLAALFIATGQDVACVSEASVGITRMEVTESNDLYAAVTLPNLIVGTIGGGTQLPTQEECLAIMQCNGAGTSRKYAEICGAMLLAGELSIAAAISAGHFTRAHEILGRIKGSSNNQKNK